jgi:GT2 family glycosyltransferase
MDVPIVVVCYNNYKYVENTLKQIKKLNLDYYKNIIIMDNCSNDAKTIEYLNSVDVKVIRNSTNVGPWVNYENNVDVYHSLPDRFILTDPDLEMNSRLPQNFIDVLVELSDKYQCGKIGFALDISDYDKMYQFAYFHGVTICEWEKQFWMNRINDDKYELYWAEIDTAFCLVNKKYGGSDIRVAGDFTAKHLPWYINNKLLSLTEVYDVLSKTTPISTLSRVLLPHIESNYSKIENGGEIRFLPKDS